VASAFLLFSGFIRRFLSEFVVQIVSDVVEDPYAHGFELMDRIVKT
jgi:hypothetical protein